MCVGKTGVTCPLICPATIATPLFQGAEAANYPTPLDPDYVAQHIVAAILASKHAVSFLSPCLYVLLWLCCIPTSTSLDVFLNPIRCVFLCRAQRHSVSSTVLHVYLILRRTPQLAQVYCVASRQCAGGHGCRHQKQTQLTQLIHIQTYSHRKLVKQRLRLKHVWFASRSQAQFV